MDDGFQNPSLAKDFSVLVVDARRGIGNGRVIPGRTVAGAACGAARARACAGRGRDRLRAPPTSRRHARARDIPVFAARLRARCRLHRRASAARRVLAFAGIGDPEKFFATLAEAGIAVAATRSFPDHHRYTRGEAQALCDEAEREGLALVTTEKDLARLAGDDGLAPLAAHAHALPVALAFEEEDGFRSLLLERLAAATSTSSGDSSRQ